VSTALNTLLTALHVWIDDYLGPRRHGDRPPNTGPTPFDPLTLLAGGLVLAVLQTKVDWTRSDTGRWRPGRPPIAPWNWTRRATWGSWRSVRRCRGRRSQRPHPHPHPPPRRDRARLAAPVDHRRGDGEVRPTDYRETTDTLVTIP
jgi:hypothetical protein